MVCHLDEYPKLNNMELSEIQEECAYFEISTLQVFCAWMYAVSTTANDSCRLLCSIFFAIQFVIYMQIGFYSTGTTLSYVKVQISQQQDGNVSFYTIYI